MPLVVGHESGLNVHLLVVAQEGPEPAGDVMVSQELEVVLVKLESVWKLSLNLVNGVKKLKEDGSECPFLEQKY